MITLSEEERNEKLNTLAENLAALLDAAHATGLEPGDITGVLGVLLHAGLDTSPGEEVVVRLHMPSPGIIESVRMLVRQEPIEA